MASQLRASSSLSSASSTDSWRHDVFLSFRGEDTRYNFTGHLHRNLVQRGINTFIDDDDLPRGEEISEALLRAIEGSKLSLIVFSENYASSKWCLDELVHILGCRRSKKQMVRPIFYKVDPSDVRHQRGTFGEALAEHERIFKDDRINKVLRWRTALSEAANLSGWHFSGRKPIRLWQALLDGHRRSPLQDIQKILKISYDALEEPEKEMFLHIACFFKYKNKNDVIAILERCGYSNPRYSIEVLEEKALLNVEHSYIFMHDLLEEMGKKIVHEESPKEPGRRSRLWYHNDVLQVLTEDTGTRTIEGIMVKMATADVIRLSPNCFKNMINLQFFINVNGRFCGRIDYFPKQLRYLDWPDCPLKFFPSDINMKNLVQLSMPCSRISRFGKEFKSMENLKSLNLKGCKFLAQSPDLSGSPNLELLDLSWCTSLKKIHPSVGSLQKLITLNLARCSNLMTLPEKVNWRSLREINLGFCRRLKSFPEIMGEMKYMTSLTLLVVGIKALPSSIGYLINLERLSLISCGNLTDLPCSIYELQKLGNVYLNGCRKLVRFLNKVDSEVLPTYSKVSHDNRDSLSKRKILNSLEPEPDTEFNLALPSLARFIAYDSNLSNIDFLASLDSASTLEELDLRGSPIVILPECINKFVNLRKLNLSGCTTLVEIPELPPRISRLDVRDCVSLERISKLSNIVERKESQIMIEVMDLTNCWRLCQNLVQMANKDGDDEVHADLFSRLLSSPKSKFTITFPVPRSEFPKWFSCQMDFKGHPRFEFWIETLANFRWENTLLAVCVAVDPHLEYECTAFEVFIHINEVRVSVVKARIDSEESNHVWLHYVPFLEMWRRVGYMRPLPPFTCRVDIYQDEDSVSSIKSCGVHLVMPPNEDVCMKLIRAENLANELSDDEVELSDDEVDQDLWED